MTFAEALEYWRPIQADVLRGQRRRGWQHPWRPNGWTRHLVVAAIQRWAAEHDGLPPRVSDWTPAGDPRSLWPRSSRVKEMFAPMAEASGMRHWVPGTGSCPCWCHQPNYGYMEIHASDDLGRTWSRPAEPGELDCACASRCAGEGTGGYWAGLSGWEYAVYLAGHEPRRGNDHHATRSMKNAFGRNRQIVTGGAHAPPNVVHVPHATGRGHVR